MTVEKETVEKETVEKVVEKVTAEETIVEKAIVEVIIVVSINNIRHDYNAVAHYNLRRIQRYPLHTPIA